MAILIRALLCRNLGPDAPSGPRALKGRLRRPRLGNESGFFERKSAIIDFTSTIGPCRPSPITEFWSTSAADCNNVCVTGCPACDCNAVTECDDGTWGCRVDVVVAAVIDDEDEDIVMVDAGGFGSMGRWTRSLLAASMATIEAFPDFRNSCDIAFSMALFVDPDELIGTTVT